MDKKTPSDFSTHDEWLSYVRDNVPAADRGYALAYGRAELFKNFYRVRKQTFPEEFQRDVERIQLLHDPHRTNELESLNERIFASLTELLFSQAQPRLVETETAIPASPQEQVTVLLTALNVAVAAIFGGPLYLATANHPVWFAGVSLLFAALFVSLVRVWIVTLRFRFR